MATYPLATLGPTIDASGISIPSYNDVYQSLLAQYKQIYGSDIYVDPDSQDGQWIAVIAKAVDDANQAAIVAFNSMSPSYSQGAQLSALVKLNGIRRNVASHSTAVGIVVGQAGTTITNGVVKDANGNMWNLPASVVIPVGGSVTVTVTAQNAGSLAAPAGTISTIYNPQYGWQSFVSTSDATPGAPVEADPTLRARRENSVAMPGLTIKQAISAAVGNVTGVTRHFVHENDTDAADTDGVPAHNISVIVEGGSAPAIAAAIASRKIPGGPTYGTTTQTVYDSSGVPATINYFTLAYTDIYFQLAIKALPGYLSSTGQAIVTALVDFVNALGIGEDVYYSQSQAVAALISVGMGQTFYIQNFYLGTTAFPSGTSNVAIPFNKAARCASGNIVLTVS